MGQREQELGAPRVAEARPLGTQIVVFEPERVDDRLVLGRVIVQTE